ncbi:MAG: hypothetical protein C5B55_09280, partial [Blastocatellia bacterium]
VTAFLVAFSPLIAIVGVSPSADAPTNWFVLGGLWVLLIGVKKHNGWLAFAAGAIFGGACWLRVNPLLLSGFLATAIIIFDDQKSLKRIQMGGLVVLGTVLVISPIVIRNYVSFPDFTPLGGTIGINLWEGLGETDLGRSNGFLYGDHLMIERERVQMGLSPDSPIEAMWPDGIKRERARTRESLHFIAHHPFWYSGVMLRRMWGMLKVAGDPSPYYGTAGINVTSKKCLPTTQQSGILALLVNLLGMIQSVTRYALLPLAVVGCWLAISRNWIGSLLLLTIAIYYLVPGTAAHTEIRYVLSLHCVIAIFAALGLCKVIDTLALTVSKHATHS